MIYDKFKRPVLSARISITKKCNLDCIYCHKEGIFDDSKREMTPEEIQRIIGICKAQGIKKVKITGAEPILRNDVVEIVEGISDVGIEDISMTTNGIYLADYAAPLKESGLNRVNVSLDTLKPDVFKEITCGGDINKVKRGIDAAIDAGLYPVKLNIVAMKGINESELEEFLDQYNGDGVVIQLIELVDTNKEIFDTYYHSLDKLEDKFEKNASEVMTRKFQGRKKYTLNGSQVEVIRPMHNTDFCSHCTRIRITADGKFKPCLMRSDNIVDFLTPMREGATDEILEGLLKEATLKREPFQKEA